MRASSRSQAGSSSSTTSGSSSAWLATPPPCIARAHPLEDEALVRGMLVDEDEPVLGLGDDIGFRDLPAGDAEGEVYRLGDGRMRGFGAGLRRGSEEGGAAIVEREA